MKKLSLVTLIIFGIFAVSCGGDEEPTPEPCVSEGMRYSVEMKTIIDNTCATAGCHESGGSATFPMGTFDQAKQAVAFGRIIGAINHTVDFSPMPKDADKLDQCTIDKITNWVENGAPW